MIHPDYKILTGDVRDVLATLPDQHFHCVVTSPPYFGLRDYGIDGQMGLEPTPDDFVAAMVDVFNGVWRVLRDDGVVWLNLGDSYASQGGTGQPRYWYGNNTDLETQSHRVRPANGIKAKDLLGMPWRVAFALQAEGWYLRDAIVWHKPAPMPGSQRDRCTSAYEFIFQLTKQPRYYFDMEAIKEDSECDRMRGPALHGSPDTNGNDGLSRREPQATRTPRNVWKIVHEGFSEAHFATFPRELPRRCIKASTSERGVCPQCGAGWVRVVERGDSTRQGPTASGWREATERSNPAESVTCGTTDSRTVGWEPGCMCAPTRHAAEVRAVPARVLDPFAGAGTTLIAAAELGRESVGIELNPEYVKLAEERIARELRPGTYTTESDEPAGPLFAEDEHE